MIKTKPISTIDGINKIDFSKIDESTFWNSSNTEELKIHKIHAYPAKFPSLIARKAFEYAKKKKIKLESVSDIFCGCGTVAVEAKRHNLNFWGCDLNPVAVLISRAKSNNYCVSNIDALKKKIILRINEKIDTDYNTANTRLKYWFSEEQYNELFTIKTIVLEETEDDKYRVLFLAVFSSILKASSKWLTKSIKPQVDPNKKNKSPIELFKKQLELIVKAIIEANFKEDATNIIIEQADVRTIQKENFVDMVITSPPYVTSYEYADLHQLSSLWLDYTEDYTELRKNSIGTSYGIVKNQDLTNLSLTAKKIVSYFNINTSQGQAIKKYYEDMKQFAQKSFDILKEKGLAIFVIGDTEIRKHHIENAKCLSEYMIEAGFKIKEISKRAVQNKFLPSHRDENGKFSSNPKDRTIYSQEYIIIGSKG